MTPPGVVVFFLDFDPPTPPTLDHHFLGQKQGSPHRGTPPFFTSEQGGLDTPPPALGCARNIPKILWGLCIYALRWL